MSSKDVSVIFDVVITLDKTEGEIADCGKERLKESNENDPIPLVDGEEWENRISSGR